MSRVLTKDNRLFFDDSKRVVTLAPGQLPSGCKCCGGGGGLCCEPYGPGIQRLLQCGLGLSPQKQSVQGSIHVVGFCTYTGPPWNPGVKTSVIDKSGPIELTSNGTFCAYDGQASVQQVVPNKNFFAVSILFESFNVLNPANLPTNSSMDLCTNQQGPNKKYVQRALINWGALIYNSDGTLAVDMGGNSNYSNWLLGQDGQTFIRATTKLSPPLPGVTCSSSVTGGLGSGCESVLNLSQSAVYVYPQEKLEFQVNATITIPWINECGTGDKPPPPPPPTSGCSSCGKKRNYTAL